MPIIRSAAKKLRQARKRSLANKAQREELRRLVTGFRRRPSAKGLAGVSSKLAKAAKTRVIHRNKAARLLSRLAKLVPAGRTPKKKA